MHTSASLFIKIALVAGALIPWTQGKAQNQTVTGNLTVNGSSAVLNGPFSVGVATFAGPSTLAGLTIAYDDIAQIGVDDDYQPGQSTIYQLAAQALAEFHWQYTDPTTGAQDLMLLSNDVLSVLPSIQGNGTANILPNQTLSAGGSSILTKTLADGLYLSSAGGTITGNVTITGSASIGTLSTNFTGLGTDNRLTNQVANHVNSILTKGIADGMYLSAGNDAGIPFKFGQGAVITTGNSIALGHHAQANNNAISIGAHSGSVGSMASGEGSISLGYAARGVAPGSVAVGGGTWAGGDHSVSVGSEAGSLGLQSIAIGRGTLAYRKGQVVLGNFNAFESTNHSPDAADNLFILGNGNGVEGDSKRYSNAFAIKRNGNVEVTGQLAGAGSLVMQGTDNRLPNQVADNANSILTKGIADQQYVKIKYEGSSFVYGDSAFVEWSGIAIGSHAHANTNAISIGTHAGYMGPMVSGIESVAIGFATRAGAERSVTLGHSSWGAGVDSFAVNGGATRAARTVAIGLGSEATRPGQIVLGPYNDHQAVSEWAGPSDHIFVIGNGTADNARSNAFVVRRNGNVEVKGTSLTVNGSEVLTQAAAETTYVTQTAAAEYFIKSDDSNSELPNQTAVSEHSILTRRLADARYLHLVDEGTIAFGEYAEAVPGNGGSLAMGLGAMANVNAVSIGVHAGHMETMASGARSVSLGYGACAPGTRAIAVGSLAWSPAEDTIAIGADATVLANRATALGKGVVATHIGQIALGSFNLSVEPSTTVSPEDPIFVLGNGTADSSRSNAFVIKRNGDVEVKGTNLTINGAEVLTATSASSLYVTQSSASTTYLTVTAAAAQYQTKPEGEAEFLTSDDLVAIQADIDAKIDEDELAEALENLTPGGGSGNYLSKDPAIGLAYGTGSQASAATSAAIGEHVTANRTGQVVVGRYNVATAGSSPGPDDPVFIVGAGSGESGQPDERKNALVVKKNGDVNVSGVLRVKESGNLSMGEFDDGPEP